MRFYLGTHSPNWLWQTPGPWMVSHTRLHQRRTFGRAVGPWVLDSGAFTELRRHGRFTVGAEEYAEAAARYAEQIGGLVWAAPQDWMCEPFMLQRTGLTVPEHQHRTVANYLELRGQGPFIPVLQGWTLADYHRCADLYAQAGIDLAAEPVVGLGSVCRRQSSAEIAIVVGDLAQRGLQLHGFGVKTAGVRRLAADLASADSMAWSYDARRTWPLPGCTHRTCANCRRYALRWRDHLTQTLGQLCLEIA